jgi:uncharacterized protein (TIGR04255 family)
MPTPNPSYPNPTIQEVNCEIYFRLQESDVWNPLWYFDFYQQISGQFPVPEPVSEPRYSQTVSGNIISQAMRYKNSEGNLILQLSEDRFVIVVLPDYPGWGRISETIKEVWEKARQIIEPVAVSRIGLRYINIIERKSREETLGDWIITNDYIPPIVLRVPSFAGNITAQLNNSDRLSVVIGDVTRTDSDSSSSQGFLFDIDRVTERELSIDPNELLQEISRLHDDVWDVFSSAKGERLEQLLQGEIL